jgi:bacteriocin-like protein
MTTKDEKNQIDESELENVSGGVDTSQLKRYVIEPVLPGGSSDTGSDDSGNDDE